MFALLTGPGLGRWLARSAGNGASAVLLILLSMVMVACGRQSQGTTSPVVPTQAAEPATTASATAGSPLEAAPTVTIAASATATVAQPATPASCQFDYFFEPAPEACPAGPAVASAAAEQPFEGGVMIWLAETDSIAVFHEDGRWQRFEDTWSEGEPENDPSIAPPDGRFQPIRGFGKLWRENPEVRDALGWALGVELGFDSLFQDQRPGPDRPTLTYLRSYNGQVFALISRAPDEGEWVVAADNR